MWGAMLVLLVGCSRAPVATAPRPAQASVTVRPASPLDGSTQMVLVVTPAWDSTSGSLRRFERETPRGAWRQVGGTVPIVVGRTGVAWDGQLGLARAGEPVKREGDGRSPAGMFPLDTAFGFDARQSVPWVRLPYVQLRTTTECVDDGRSVHYNTIVDRDGVPRVDWTSSEKMRSIGQYEYGVHVAYNAPPTPSRGSCIFLHICAGPESVTAGCTAMNVDALKELIGWLDPRRRPMLVQLPASALETRRKEWSLP
jgi:L,D-peptidoglycan transpeptidase YkuD (ErfK/YbiS/YcfS/YnhG family)